MVGFLRGVASVRGGDDLSLYVGGIDLSVGYDLCQTCVWGDGDSVSYGWRPYLYIAALKGRRTLCFAFQDSSYFDCSGMSCQSEQYFSIFSPQVPPSPVPSPRSALRSGPRSPPLPLPSAKFSSPICRLDASMGEHADNASLRDGRFRLLHDFIIGDDGVSARKGVQVVLEFFCLVRFT